MERTQERMFEILVREHERAILAFVLSQVHDLSSAEDIVQDSFLVAWQQLEAYDEQRPFVAWVRGIAKNKVLEYLRNKRTEGRYIAQLDADLIQRIVAEFESLLSGRGALFSEMLTALSTCLRSLPESPDTCEDQTPP